MPHLPFENGIHRLNESRRGCIVRARLDGSVGMDRVRVVGEGRQELPVCARFPPEPFYKDYAEVFPTIPCCGANRAGF